MGKINFDTHLENLRQTDSEVYNWVVKEIERQETTLELIPSENAASPSTMESLGSVLVNKYSEGYPNARYYGGNEYVDKIESLAQERAKKLFEVPHVNVQPYSGSPANFAVYTAVCEPGDVVMGHSLPDGGHLTHGWKSSATAKYFTSVQYHVKEDGLIDLEELKELAIKNKPKLIWVGATAYPREVPFEEVSKIADEVGAYLAADISHISGLVASKVHISPKDYAHIITTTTHKTLRGPRGGMIMVTQKGLDKDPELAKKIDKAIFPGLQGGPHDNQITALAVTLGEALKPDFIEYSKQIVKNTKALAQTLLDENIKLVSNGSDNHLLLIDCGTGKGQFLQDALDKAGITLNKNTIPKEPFSPFFPSGVRLGTPIMTTRGMKEEEMKKVGKWIANICKYISKFEMPRDKEERKKIISKFNEEIEKEELLIKTREEVKELCKEFPLYK